MPLRSPLAACLLLLAGTASATDKSPLHHVPPNEAPMTLWRQAAVDPPMIRLLVGDRAPHFTYLGLDGKWHRFAELAADGSVLLLFGAKESDVQALEQARPVFQDLGVVPVLVVDMRSGSAAALMRRLGISGPIISDPMRAIAALYNSLDPRTLMHAPSFFLLDERGTIRALRHGELPAAAHMLGVSARVLGRPLPESAWTLSKS